jgi:hypothetical protein
MTLFPYTTLFRSETHLSFVVMQDLIQLESVELLHRQRLRLTEHSTYSLDFIPSYFCLFGYVNHCVQGMAFPLQKELHTAIREIVAAISKKSCPACLSTEWRDLNGFLRIMVTIDPDCTALHSVFFPDSV